MKTLFIVSSLFLILFSPAYAVIINGIACEVGNSVITIHEFNTTYEWEAHMALLLNGTVPTKKRVMDALINNLLIKTEAENRGIVVTESEIDTIVENIKKQNNLSDADFERELSREKMTIEDLRERYRNEILKNRLISQMVSMGSSTVSDQEMKDFYEDPANRSYFSVPPMVKLSQIYIAVKEDTSYQEAKELKEQARRVYELAQSGHDFQDLVGRYSMAAGKEKNRGYLGSFTVEQLEPLLPPDHIEQIFSLEAGDTVPPVRLPDGYYIFRIEEKSSEKQLSFNDAYENIKSYLLKQKGDRIFSTWLIEKRERTKIQYLIELE